MGLKMVDAPGNFGKKMFPQLDDTAFAITKNRTVFLSEKKENS
jgi:Fe-S cluster biosynthesis and repair protein YggX